MLNIENISKSFGSQVLFQRASFLIGEQARMGILGPNGSGKTTFLKILAGEESLDEGQIRKPKNFRIGFMRQEWKPHERDSILEATLREHKDWHSARQQLRRLEGRLGKEPSPQELQEYQKLEHAYTVLGGYGVEQTAQELLSGLGFSPKQFLKPCQELSGGWRIRVHIAGLLLQKADLLLLDEPTNHLDIESVAWFEKFLKTYPHAVLLISHDRRLIERFSTEILDFSPPTLTLWPGGLKKFEELKKLRREQLESEIENKEREIEQLKDFVDRFRAKATKARQAQNRLKTSQHFEEQIQKLKTQMPMVVRRPSRFHLTLPRRLPRIVLEIQESSIGYPKHPSLFSIPHCVLEAGKKIGVIGANGVGKSTFLKSCAGELEPLSGKFNRKEGVTLGYFAQHRMEELPSQIKAWDYLYDQNFGNSISEVRSVAAALGLSANDLDKSIEILSGGEKARVSLSRILLSRPGLLLLDEPTNHLDMEACDALIRGLDSYEGTVLVVSHNRDFLDSLVEMILEIQPGQAIFHHGNYTDWFARSLQRFELIQDSLKKEFSPPKNKIQRQEEKENRQKILSLLREVRKKFSETEKSLHQLQEEQRQLDSFLCSPESPKNSEFGNKVKRRTQLEEELEVLETSWLQLMEEQENLKKLIDK